MCTPKIEALHRAINWYNENMNKEITDGTQHSKIVLSSVSQGQAANTFSACDLKQHCAVLSRAVLSDSL